jgi:hypothetical protein
MLAGLYYQNPESAVNVMREAQQGSVSRKLIDGREVHV